MKTLDSKNLQLIKELRHQLHQHPELSNQENWTKEYLVNFLAVHTKLEIIDKGLWFYAVYRAEGDRENIAFRADFDAVPMEEKINIPYASKHLGIAHKCGHDGHAACLAGFALEIDQKGADKNIYFLFQHAEETGDGAAECTSFIKDNNIHEIFAFHNMSGLPLRSVNVINGTAHYASKGMTIHMEGLPAHASEPEKGINPAFAIARLINTIPELISSKDNKGVVLCTVIQVDIGEKAFGVSASKGDLLLTIRAQFESELNKLQASLEDIAREQAQRYGLNVSFCYNDMFPETSNYEDSVDKIRQVCRAKNMQLIEMKDAYRCSEDFGHYLKLTKGAICYIGNGEEHPPLHTFEYDFPDDIIATAVELFIGLSEL